MVVTLLLYGRDMIEYLFEAEELIDDFALFFAKELKLFFKNLAFIESSPIFSLTWSCF